MARILIVDDDDAMRDVIRDHLSKTYEIIDTGVSENVLGLVLRYRPDAILLDLAIPGVSGFELCHILSSLSFTKHIPILVISGEDERNKAFCRNLGATKFFPKPIDFGKLKADLDSAIGVSSERSERRADPRIEVALRVDLKGRRKDGACFEGQAEVENMSRGGFLCATTSQVEEAAIVEVWLSGSQEHSLGRARLVRVVGTNNPTSHYGFQFIGTDGLA